MGIGTQLVAKAEEWAKQNGASLIVLSSVTALGGP